MIFLTKGDNNLVDDRGLYVPVSCGIRYGCFDTTGSTVSHPERCRWTSARVCKFFTHLCIRMRVDMIVRGTEMHIHMRRGAIRHIRMRYAHTHVTRHDSAIDRYALAQSDVSSRKYDMSVQHFFPAMILECMFLSQYVYEHLIVFLFIGN